MLRIILIAMFGGALFSYTLPASGTAPAESDQTVAADEKRSSGLTFESSTLVGTTVWTSSIQSGMIPARGFAMDFDAGGTGVSYEKINPTFGIGVLADVPEAYTWTINSGVLEISFADFSESSFPFLIYPFDELSEVYGFDQSVVDFMNAAFENGQISDIFQVEMTFDRVGRSVSPESMGDRRLVVSTTEISEYRFDAELIALNWPGPLPRGQLVETIDQEVYLESELTNVLVNQPAAGDEWALPFLFRPLDPQVIEETEEGLFTDSLTLDGLGSTSAGALSSKSFSWSATADGLTLQEGTEEYTYIPLESDGSVYFALVTYASEGDVLLRNAQWIARSDGTGSTLAPDLVQPIPFYWQAGINSSLSMVYRDTGQLDPVWVFGYSFANDGTSFRIFPPAEDACVLGDGEACFFAEGEPFWTWSASGDTITRDRMQTFLSRTRTWKVMNYQPGGLATVLEWEVRQLSEDPWGFLINPRINTLEIFNLSSWPKEWADSVGFYDNVDDDGDGIANAADNCLQVASTDLRDGDADGIGTACDTDHNQDCVVNFLDLALFANNFLGTDPNFDYNGDGLINFVDLVQLRDSFFSDFSSDPDVSGVPTICD